MSGQSDGSVPFRAAPGAFSPCLGPVLAVSEAPGSEPAFSSQITHPSLQVFFFFFFLFYAQLSFPSCLQGLLRPHSGAGGKCQGWSMSPVPVSLCCSSGKDPIKTFFHMEGKKRGAVPRSLLPIPRVPCAKRRFSFVTQHPSQSSARLINLLKDPRPSPPLSQSFPHSITRESDPFLGNGELKTSLPSSFPHFPELFLISLL